MKSLIYIPSRQRVALFAYIALRAYSSSSAIPEDLQREFKSKFDPLYQEFSNHRAIHHPFFEYLKEQSQIGFTPEQYKIYRDNFFRRTELTIPAVARFIERAALEGDSQAVVDTIRNLNDEGGYGDVNKMHSNLLLYSHNFHGMRVFGLDPLHPLSEAKNSPNLVPEVEEYRRAKQQAFEMSYPFVAGNTWAHELAADQMLDNFRLAFFKPYQSRYIPEEYQKITEFFTAHKDDSKENGDIEAQHGRMAREVAERACKLSLSQIALVREGGLAFLCNQEKLWDGMSRKIEKAESKGDIVLTNDKPNTILSRAVVMQEISKSETKNK